MIVIHGAGTHKLMKGIERVTSSELTRDGQTWGRLGSVFGVVPPLAGGAEIDLANFIRSHDVTAFVLHRGGVGLEFVRLLFGDYLTLRRIPYNEPPCADSPSLLKFLQKRDVDCAIEQRFPEPDVEWQEAGFAFHDDEDEGGGWTEGEAAQRPRLQPLAEFGESTNICVVRRKVGIGAAILLPLGRRLDAEDVRLLEQVAAPPPKKVEITVHFTNLEQGNASIQVDDHAPEKRSGQWPAILAAFAKRREATLQEIGIAMQSPMSLARQRPVGDPVLTAKAIGNRIDKLNQHFRDKYDLAYNVVVTPPGKKGVRRLDGHVTLKVKGLSD